MTMGIAIAVVMALVAYVVLMRWVFPRLGIKT